LAFASTGSAAWPFAGTSISFASFSFPSLGAGSASSTSAAERSKSWVCLNATGFDAANLGLPAAMNNWKETT
jgi:hypothetical protein